MAAKSKSARAGVHAQVVSKKRLRTVSNQTSHGPLARILHAAPAGIGTIIDRVIRETNKSLCEMTGYSREELVGQSASILFSPDAGFDFEGKDKYDQTGERGASTVETQWKRKDGSVLHIIFSSALLHPEDPSRGIAFTAVDITERKQAEEALSESEAFRKKVFESSRIPMVVMDAATLRYVDCNPAATEIYRFSSREETLGKTPMDVSAPVQYDGVPSTEKVRDYVQQTLTVGTTTFEWRHRRPDGEIWDAMVYLMSLKSGERQFLQFTLQDVTRRKQAEAALHETMRRLHTVVTGAPIVLYSFDHHGVFTLSEGKGLVGLGLKPGEIVGRTIFEVYGSQPEAIAALRRALAGETFTVELSFTAGGTFEVSHIAMRDATGGYAGTIGVLVDITERKQAEEEILRLNRELEQRVVERTAQLEDANKELEAFAYSVSHDLRAPLRAIDGYSRILVEDHLDSLDSEGRRVCSVVRTETQRMGQLIDDLLSFSRLSRGHMQASGIQMAALVNSTFHDVTTPESRDRIEFRVDAVPDATGDPDMIRQVWANLLLNAVKFTSKKVQPSIEVRGSRSGTEVIYSVRDNGVGFDMKYAGKLFGVFQRLHSSREFDGTGVGLAIVQRVIHRHGGRVWANGEPDKGATFSFTLPQKGS